MARPWRFAAFELLGRQDRGALHRLRDSPVCVVVRHRSVDVDVLDEVLIGRPYEPPSEVVGLLADGMSVLDLGGNVGVFGAFVLQRFPRALVTSVEADPFNQPVLERCIELNGGNWRLIPACASVSSDPVLFEAGRYGHSRVVEAPSANTVSVSAIDVFPLIDSARFVKMDIEGGEWPILLDPRFQRVTPSVIVLEWHERGCPVADPWRAATVALNGAGYQTLGGGSGWPHGILWAWRRSAI